MSKWYKKGMEGTKVLDDNFVGQRTRPVLNLTIDDDTKFSSFHIPYTNVNNILYPVSFFILFPKLQRDFSGRLFQCQHKTISAILQYMRVYSKRYQNVTYGRWIKAKILCTSSRRFVWWKVHCNTFYEDHCCTSCFDSKKTKILNNPRIWLAILLRINYFNCS